MLGTTRNKRVIHIITSVVLCILWAALGVSYFYLSPASYSGLGFALFIIYSLAVGVALGLSATLLRLFNAIGNTSFLYRFIGIANIILGVVGVLIMLFAEMDATWLILFVFCWILGGFMLQDAFSQLG